MARYRDVALPYITEFIEIKHASASANRKPIPLPRTLPLSPTSGEIGAGGVTCSAHWKARMDFMRFILENNSGDINLDRGLMDPEAGSAYSAAADLLQRNKYWSNATAQLTHTTTNVFTGAVTAPTTTPTTTTTTTTTSAGSGGRSVYLPASARDGPCLWEILWDVAVTRPVEAVDRFMFLIWLFQSKIPATRPYAYTPYLQTFQSGMHGSRGLRDLASNYLFDQQMTPIADADTQLFAFWITHYPVRRVRAGPTPPS